MSSKKPLSTSILRPGRRLLCFTIALPEGRYATCRGNDADNAGANSTKIDNTRYPAYNPGMASLSVDD